MRFLADENIPSALVKALRHAGHDIKDAKEEKLSGASDETVLGRGLDERRIVLTLDKDFLHVAQNKPFSHAGIIVIRFSNLHSGNLVKNFLPLVKSKKTSGKFRNSIAIIYDGYIEIIKKPLGLEQ